MGPSGSTGQLHPIRIRCVGMLSAKMPDSVPSSGSLDRAACDLNWLGPSGPSEVGSAALDRQSNCRGRLCRRYVYVVCSVGIRLGFRI